VHRACILLKVSRAAYYAWSARTPSARSLSDEELLTEILAEHKASRGTYGAPRITRALRARGLRTSRKRVARLMARRGLAGRARRRTKRTTVADPAAAKTADLLQRDFAPGAHALDTVWCGDISYVRTWEGWAYVATVIDLASRRVVGLAMADHLRTSLVSEALEMAVALRRPQEGLIFHTDRGCQYTAGDFRELLAKHKITQSLSRPGQCSRQRRRRELLRNAERGAPLPRRLADPKRREARHLRVRRGLLQPPADALLAGLPHAGRLRSKTQRSGRRSGSVRNVSVRAGQPQGA
jgi:transposase InsO family protein